MTSFEKMLIEKGYEKFVFDSKNDKYIPCENQIISTLGYLDYEY